MHSFRHYLTLIVIKLHNSEIIKKLSVFSLCYVSYKIRVMYLQMSSLKRGYGELTIFRMEMAGYMTSNWRGGAHKILLSSTDLGILVENLYTVPEFSFVVPCFCSFRKKFIKVIKDLNTYTFFNKKPVYKKPSDGVKKKKKLLLASWKTLKKVKHGGKNWKKQGFFLVSAPVFDFFQNPWTW